MSSRRKCEKRHICFLTSIYREGIRQTVCSFALQILRQELLHRIPRKTRHVRWLLRCTPCSCDGSKPERLKVSICCPLYPGKRTHFLHCKPASIRYVRPGGVQTCAVDVM